MEGGRETAGRCRRWMRKECTAPLSELGTANDLTTVFEPSVMMAIRSSPLIRRFVGVGVKKEVFVCVVDEFFCVTVFICGGGRETARNCRR